MATTSTDRQPHRLPTRWHDTSIIVLDAVRINPPYRPEDCLAAAKDATALARVKKILDFERKKLGLQQRPSRAGSVPVALPVPNNIERKGG
jgi:hypothetical protein